MKNRIHLIPGPEKEQWKARGNRYDCRELEASRPTNLRITISPPRQFLKEKE